MCVCVHECVVFSLLALYARAVFTLSFPPHYSLQEDSLMVSTCLWADIGE